LPLNRLPDYISSNISLTGVSADYLDGIDSSVLSWSLRANRNLSGGGTITFDSSSNLFWSNRFIIISNGRSPSISTDGYFDIYCPTSGTITGVGGLGNKTATAAGIQILPWEALYYVIPIGQSTVAGGTNNFRIASYGADVDIPHNWVLIAVRNGDDSRLYLNNGIILDAGQSQDGSVQSYLRVGTSNTENYIAFRGTTGDDPGSFTNTYIGERFYGGTESSELLLFKGNDVEGVSGPERIRSFAANHQFDTYTAATGGTFSVVGAAASVTRMIIKQGGNVGIGTITPDTIGASSTAAMLGIVANATTTVGLVVRGIASQSANLQEWQDSAAVVRTQISPSGVLTLRPVSYAANQSAGIEITDTTNSWSTAKIRLVSDGSGNPRLGIFAPSVAIENISVQSGSVGIRTAAPLAILHVSTAGAASIGTIIQGAASQSANLQEWQNSSGTVLAKVDSAGSITGVDLTLSGNLTVNGTTTNINTTNLVVEDKNIILGDVTTPSNTTADGGGITLKGATDKTFNWVNSTGYWTSNVGVEANSFVKTSGTSSQFLKADGSVDSATYLTTGTASSTYAPIASPTFTGAPAWPNSKVYGFTRTMPTTVDNIVELGSTTLSNGAGSFEISIVVPSSSFSVSKQYLIPVNYDETANNWRIVNPIGDGGPSNSNDFTLEINVSLAVASFRLRRSLGTTAGTAYISLKINGNAPTFTESSSTASVTAPTTYYNGAIITQKDGAATINGNLTATQLIRSGGTSSQFLKADGSIDSTTYAPLASPSLTGTPLSTTAAIDTNTTQIATTAFVVGQASGANPLALGTVAQGTSLRYSRQDHVHSNTADQFIASNNGNGTNFRVGDDVWLGDIDVANTMSIRGLQSAASGFVRFGSDTNPLGYNGTTFSYGGTFNAAGVTTSGALALNYASPAITSNNASAASIFTSTVTGVTIGSSTIKTTDYPVAPTGTTSGTVTQAAQLSGYIGMPQNAQATSGTFTYSFAASDAGKHIYATGTPTSVTFTIPANSAVAFEIGTTFVVMNDLGAATNISIAITTDTMQLAGTGTTGTRTLARYGVASITKVTATKWIISGNGLT
jgi:hypothetical protein